MSATKPSLVDLENKPKTLRKDAISITEKIYDPIQPYAKTLGRDQPLVTTDDILVTQYSGLINSYREIYRDDQVSSCFGSLQQAVVSADYIVEPKTNSGPDKSAADFIRDVLTHIKYNEVTKKMLLARFFGYSVAELLPSRDGYGRFIGLEKVIVLNQGSFVFDPDYRLKMLTETQPFNGVHIDERYFWNISYGALTDVEPYGLGLAHHCYWPVYFKRIGWDNLAQSLERWAVPPTIARFPTAWAMEGPDENPWNVQQLKALSKALEAIHQGHSVRAPKDVEFEPHETSRTGNSDFEMSIRLSDEAISKVILGHSAGADSTAGRLGNENMAEGVRLDLAKASSNLINDAAMDHPVSMLTYWNFPNANTPIIKRRLEPEEDLNETSSVFVNLKTVRPDLQPTIEEVQERFGVIMEEVPVENNKETGNREDDSDTNDFSSLEFAGVQLDKIIDALEDKDFSEQSRQVLKPVLDKIESMSPEEALEQLAELAPDVISVENLNAKLQFLARTEGRIDAESGF